MSRVIIAPATTTNVRRKEGRKERQQERKEERKEEGKDVT